MLYPIVLTLHSVTRWLVIIAAVFAIIRAITGMAFKRGWMQMDEKAGFWFILFLDIQVLFGIILYFFLSPTTTNALQNFGAAMSNAATRYFTVEHVLGMLIALILAHTGRVLSRKAPTAIQKHRRAAIWYILAILVILASIPWPFMSAGRPLL